MTESWTPLKLIEWTKGYFEKEAVPNPRLDAELLLSHTLHCKRIDLYLDHEKILGSGELSDYRAKVKRRAAREPLQYILEETEFYGLKIKVAPDVLIPRPETELLVEIILGNKDCHSERSEESPEVRSFVANAPQDDKARPRGNRPKGITAPPAASTILEIGTGSGCIAIALAKHLPETQIDATERNAAALTVARENIAAHGLSEQIALHEADLFPPDQQQYDLIVSNPPYIATAELETLQPEVRDWEPHSALDGGTDGLDIYRRIVEKLPDWLAPNGIFIGEIGSDQSETIQPFFEQARCFDSIEIKNDLAGLPRIVVAKRR